MIDASKEPIRVSDHAVVRYLERAMGLNVEIVRDHIASVCSGPAAFGAVCVRSEGVRFEIHDGVVTTVTPDGVPFKQASERNRRTRKRA